MSVAEMKLKAINHLANLKTEESVREILDQLEKLDLQENKTINLSQHYPAIREQYGSVLEKLAK